MRTRSIVQEQGLGGWSVAARRRHVGRLYREGGQIGGIIGHRQGLPNPCRPHFVFAAMKRDTPHFIHLARLGMEEGLRRQRRFRSVHRATPGLG